MNKSFAYLLPLFSKYLTNENNELDEAYFAIFVEDCYCYYKVNDKLEKRYTIQLKKPDQKNEIFQKCLSNLKRSNIFAEQFHTEQAVYISFKIPEEINDTYDRYLNGEFSKFDKKHKTYVLSFIKNRIDKDISVDVNRVFSKNEKKRLELEDKIGMKLPIDTELSSRPDEHCETFKMIS